MKTWSVYTATFYCPTSLIKIGVSCDAGVRAKSACNELNMSGKLIDMVEVGDRGNGYAVESLTHALLDEYRAFGEWFYVNREQALTAIEFAKKLVLATKLKASQIYKAINTERVQILCIAPEQAIYLTDAKHKYKANKREVGYWERKKIISNAQVAWQWGDNTVANQKKGKKK